MSGQRVAIVAGGTSGIGRAITLTLARPGHAVVAFGAEPRQTAATRDELRTAGLEATVLEGDVSRVEDCQAVVDLALQRHGAIHVLRNNAGIRPVGNILATTEEMWDRVMAVNLKGIFLLTRAALPHMIAAGGGAIVNTASTSGYAGMNHIAYCAAKGAIIPFTKSLALDHAGDRIRANVVVPGFTDTEMTASFPRETFERVASRSVAGRVGLPQDIASAVAFLVSDEAATITGTVLKVGTMPAGVPG